MSLRGKQMIAAFCNGRTVHEICKDFGVSEAGYYALVKPFPSLRKVAKEKVRKRKQREKQQIEMNKKTTKVNIPKRKKKRLPQERIKHLEDRLKREKQRNVELEKLLKIAKESLGKP